MKGSFRALQDGDVEHIGSRLREADRAELKALRNGAEIDAEKVLHQCVERSKETWVGIAPDGEPLSLLGCAALPLPGCASPWMLGTDRVGEFPKAFVREGSRLVQQWLTQHRTLLNTIHADNKQSIEWLRHLGFTIHPAKPLVPGGPLFHLFTKSAPTLVGGE